MMGSYVQIGTAKDHTLFPVFDMIKFSVKEGLFIQFHRSMKKFLLSTIKTVLPIRQRLKDYCDGIPSTCTALKTM